MLNPVEQISAGSDFVDIRTDQGARLHLLSLIKSHLADQRPLSLLRIGDGEAYAFSNPIDIPTPDDLFNLDNLIRERHWWGTSPPPEEREEIRSTVREALGSADILGVPTVWRLARDFRSHSQDWLADRNLRGLVAVLEGINQQLPQGTRLVTEERCHQILFNFESLRQLADVARRVVVVSSWSEEQFPNGLFTSAQFLQISPHTKVRDEMRDSDSLWNSYKGVNNWLAGNTEPGTLVLIGAGLIGKLFVDTAKKSGAVALDVGSTFDDLCGRQTRSVLDLISIDLTPFSEPRDIAP